MKNSQIEEVQSHRQWVEKCRVQWQELLDYQNSDEARARKAEFPGVNIVFVFPRYPRTAQQT